MRWARRVERAHDAPVGPQQAERGITRPVSALRWRNLDEDAQELPRCGLGLLSRRCCWASWSPATPLAVAARETALMHIRPSTRFCAARRCIRPVEQLRAADGAHSETAGYYLYVYTMVAITFTSGAKIHDVIGEAE
jgi:hypothetical protein